MPRCHAPLPCPLPLTFPLMQIVLDMIWLDFGAGERMGEFLDKCCPPHDAPMLPS